MLERRLAMRWWPAVAAGVSTIGAYGLVLYTAGVLVVAIRSEEDWSDSVAPTAVALGLLVAGPSALLAGRMLDVRGSRFVLVTSLVSGSALLVGSSLATDPVVFIGCSATGAAAIAGGKYYSTTMPTVTRLYPAQDRARAFAILTFLGALASPVFYPVAGALVGEFGWRPALRMLVVAMILLALPAALTLRTSATDPAKAPRTSVRAALRDRSVVRLLFAVGLAAGGVNALLLHQVGALQAAGFGLAAASALAGVRGLLQIPGRLALSPLVGRLGVRRALGSAYVLCAIGALSLLAPSTVSAAPFVVLAGIGVGLLSPLQGLLAADIYDAERLGAMSGVQQFVAAVGGALGSWVTSSALSIAGAYEATVVLLAALLLAAPFALGGEGPRRDASVDARGGA